MAPRGAWPSCGLIMVGSGTDTYDPVCELTRGHDGVCRSTAAIDQNRLSVDDPRRVPPRVTTEEGSQHG